MEKSIDEKLFFRLLQFDRIMKKNMVHGHHRKDGPGHGPRHMGCEGGPRPGPRHMRCEGGPEREGHGYEPDRDGRRDGACGHHGEHRHHHNPEKMRAFAQARLLQVLLEHEGGVRQKVLAEEMRINPSSTSELISKLESEGYAVRTVDPSDKRATLITLTEVGRARAYELEDERTERFSKFFVNLSEDEKEKLLELLEKAMDVSDEPMN